MKKLLFTILIIIPFLLPAQVIITVAGNGTIGWTGDGGAATAAELAQPIAVYKSRVGDLYIAVNDRIRKVSPDGIISSVKPFQLMLGKIIGVGMVGLTQFILWIVISVVLTMAGGTMIAKTADHAKTEEVTKAQGAQALPTHQAGNSMAVIMQSIESIPVTYILCCFLFYFLFGYLLYSAIFAAVGSAVDNETETQQFMLPITLPLIFTFALSQSFIINNPDSSLAIWLSMIPFTSPIAMMIRIPFGVPAWQLAASMSLMVIGFLFTTWVAGRIYRVGILMYGKKASYKELAKWFMYKE